MSLLTIYILFIVCLVGLALTAVSFFIAFICENKRNKNTESEDVKTEETE